MKSLVLLFALTTAAAAQAPLANPVPFPRPGYKLPSGHIQIIGCSCMAATTRALTGLYTAAHPDTLFDLRFGDNYSGMAALTFDRSAVAPLGTEFTRIGLGDNLKISPAPIAVRIAHATRTPGPGTPALGIIVNAANPITTLSLDQLTRIFTTGSSAPDIALWSQAGVTGPLAARDIHPLGPLASDELPSDDPQAGEFLSTLNFNGLPFNHAYQPLPHYADILDRVRADPAAIAIIALNQPLDAATSGVKLLPLKPTPAGAVPLDRFVYLYLRNNRTTGPDALAVSLARLALSDAGQQAIAHAAEGYLPLTPTELTIERSKLPSP
jgi:phosphate transport system substrate-binding protein